MKWFKKLSTVILIILANYFDFVLGRRACCAHFCITDDLEKSNEIITFCIDFVRDFYDQKIAACAPPQPPNAHLFCGSDNAASQAKNNYHFSWMIDYVEEDHGLQTVQQNFTAEQHGKGSFFVPFVCPRSSSCIQPSTSVCSLGVWDAEGGGGKTGAESAAFHGFEINTAHDLYTFLKQHHSQPTNSYHESLHQVDKREFHYFPRGTFLAYHPRRFAFLTYHHASKVPFSKLLQKKLIIMQTKSSNCNKAVLHVCGSQNWLARSKNNFPAPSFLSVRALHHWGFSSLLVSSISWYVSGSIFFNITIQYHLTSVVSLFTRGVA